MHHLDFRRENVFECKEIENSILNMLGCLTGAILKIRSFQHRDVGYESEGMLPDAGVQPLSLEGNRIEQRQYDILRAPGFAVKLSTVPGSPPEAFGDRSYTRVRKFSQCLHPRLFDHIGHFFGHLDEQG